MDEEFQDILEKAELAAMVKNPWTLLLFRKKYRLGPGRHMLISSSATLESIPAHKPEQVGHLSHQGTCLSDCRACLVMQAAAGMCSMQHPLPAVDW